MVEKLLVFIFFSFILFLASIAAIHWGLGPDYKNTEEKEVEILQEVLEEAVG